jgi:hypothetical protein
MNNQSVEAYNQSVEAYLVGIHVYGPLNELVHWTCTHSNAESNGGRQLVNSSKGSTWI